jgi:hypothetical protein
MPPAPAPPLTNDRQAKLSALPTDPFSSTLRRSNSSFGAGTRQSPLHPRALRNRAQARRFRFSTSRRPHADPKLRKTYFGAEAPVVRSEIMMQSIPE